MLPGVESVGEVADAVLVSVAPLATFAPTLKIRVNVADAFEARVAMLQLTEPVAPTLGFVQSNAGPVCASDTNVVPAGSASVSVTLCASLGPLFVTVTL